MAAKTAIDQDVLPPGFIKRVEEKEVKEEMEIHTDWENKKRNIVCSTRASVNDALGLDMSWGDDWDAKGTRTMFKKIMAKFVASKQMDANEVVEDGYDLYNKYAQNVAAFLRSTSDRELNVVAEIAAIQAAIKANKGGEGD
jgi:hypothetical protein